MSNGLSDCGYSVAGWASGGLSYPKARALEGYCMTWRGDISIRDRIFACLPYLLPLIDVLPFGGFLFRLFPLLSIVFVPLAPFQVIYSFPLVGLAIFFALFLLVVRNEKINHFIRFNAMQAILLDILLILVRLILMFLPLAFILQVLFNFVFIGVVAIVVYAVVQSLRGHYAEIPTLSEAVYMQVR
jgi:uncharacterized membrane protein